MPDPCKLLCKHFDIGPPVPTMLCYPMPPLTSIPILDYFNYFLTPRTFQSDNIFGIVIQLSTDFRISGVIRTSEPTKQHFPDSVLCLRGVKMTPRHPKPNRSLI